MPQLHAQGPQRSRWQRSRSGPSAGAMRSVRCAASLSLWLALASGCSVVGANTDPVTDDLPGAAVWTRTSPLDEYLDIAYLDTSAEAEKAVWDAGQQALSNCMARFGFEYFPVAYNALPDDAYTTSDSVDDPAFMATHGYGITTWAIMDPDENVGRSSDEAAYTPDPNEAIFDAMSAPEQSAYLAALRGILVPSGGDQSEPSAVDAARDISEYDAEALTEPEIRELGCYTYAEVVTWDISEARRGAALRAGVYAELFDEIALIRDSVAADSRMVAADALWSQCMSAAGHPDVATPDAAATLVWSWLDAATEGLNAQMNAAMADGDGQEVQAIESQMVAINADIAPRELELAAADVSCRDTSGWYSTRGDVSHEIESAFVASHKAELTSFKLAVLEGSTPQP